MVFICGDSRHFTSYVPNCDLEKKLMVASGTKDSYSYRQALQANGDKAMKMMTVSELDAKHPNGCSCKHKGEISKPFL